MPSFNHEARLELFRRRPRLAAELLGDALPSLDAAYVRLADSSLGDILPTERKADIVLLFASSRSFPR